MNYQKYIDLIDSYIEEPNNINSEWVECLLVCRELLQKATAKECKLFKDLCDCGHLVYPHMDYCDKCGQALVWSTKRKEDEGK